MNGSYDFSELYGEQSYDDRDLEYTFNLEASDKVGLNIARRKITEWLSDGGRQIIKDDTFPDYYFIYNEIGPWNSFFQLLFLLLSHSWHY